MNEFGKVVKIVGITWGIGILWLFILIGFCSCDTPNYTLIDHYKNDANFISSNATVERIFYSEHSGSVVIHFSGLHSDNQVYGFEIPVDIAQSDLKTTLLESIKEGDKVKFTYDPWYYGDGYIMPIVAIWSADGELLLEYEEGYANLMKWLKES